MTHGPLQVAVGINGLLAAQVSPNLNFGCLFECHQHLADCRRYLLPGNGAAIPGSVICFLCAKCNSSFSRKSPVTVQYAIGQESLCDSQVPLVPRLRFRPAEAPAINLMCEMRT